MKKLDWDKLEKFVQKNKDSIYCIYAGILEDWDLTADEVYHTDFGWLDHSAHTQSSFNTPIAYIHYKDGYDEVLGEFTDIFEEDDDK